MAPMTYAAPEAQGGRVAPGDTARFNTEEYNSIDENAFRTVRDAPLSTFAIDVDAASYSNVRRFLRDRVRECMDAEVLAPGDPDGIALTLWSLLHGLLLYGSTDGGNVDVTGFLGIK